MVACTSSISSTIMMISRTTEPFGLYFANIGETLLIYCKPIITRLRHSSIFMLYWNFHDRRQHIGEPKVHLVDSLGDMTESNYSVGPDCKKADMTFNFKTCFLCSDNKNVTKVVPIGRYIQLSNQRISWSESTLLWGAILITLAAQDTRWCRKVVNWTRNVIPSLVYGFNMTQADQIILTVNEILLISEFAYIISLSTYCFWIKNVVKNWEAKELFTSSNLHRCMFMGVSYDPHRQIGLRKTHSN